MKKALTTIVGVMFIAFSNLALSDSSESLQGRCEEQAKEDNVDPDIYDEYMSDCIRYYQDVGSEHEIEPADMEEENDETSSVQE